MECHGNPDHDGLRYTIYGEEEDIPRPLQQLIDLGNRGKLTQTVYRPCGSAWERLCALEADLIRASNPASLEYEGWSIVAGECAMLAAVTGWLECDGWVFVACPAAYAEVHGTDMLVIPQEDFESTFYPRVRARVPLGEDSGLRLNRALREVDSLETAFALDL